MGERRPADPPERDPGWWGSWAVASGAIIALLIVLALLIAAAGSYLMHIPDFN